MRKSGPAVALAAVILAGSVAEAPGAEASIVGPYPDNWNQYSLNTVGGQWQSYVTTAISWGLERWNGRGGGAPFNAPIFRMYTGADDINNYIGARGVAGVMNCAAYTFWLSARCNIFDISYNEAYLGGNSNTWKNVGCHEHGHTFGLAERPVSAASTCMNGSATGDGSRLYPDSDDYYDVQVVSFYMQNGWI